MNQRDRVIRARAIADGIPVCDQPGCASVVWCWEHEEAFLRQMTDAELVMKTARPPAPSKRFQRFQAIGRDLLENTDG